MGNKRSSNPNHGYQKINAHRPKAKAYKKRNKARAKARREAEKSA